MSLVFLTPEPVSIKLHIYLWGRTVTLSSDIFPRPLGWGLLRSHFLRGYICKVSLQEITTTAKQTWMVHMHSTKRECQHAIRKQSHWGMCYFTIHIYIHAYIFVKGTLWYIPMYMYIHTFSWKTFSCHLFAYIHIFWKAFSCYLSTYIRIFLILLMHYPLTWSSIIIFANLSIFSPSKYFPLFILFLLLTNTPLHILADDYKRELKDALAKSSCHH